MRASLLTVAMALMTLGGCGRGSSADSPIASGEVVSVTLWEKPVQRPGEVGSNGYFEIPSGSHVDVYSNFIIVTTKDGVRHMSVNGWYTNLAFKSDS